MSTREEWLAERRTGIGGSDVAAIMGVSPWTSPLQVYLEKRGELPPQPDNDAMMFGRLLEPIVRQVYADRTGHSVTVPGRAVRSARYPWLLANFDGLTDHPRVYEGKTARHRDGWGEPGSGDIPLGYLLQVQHYMIVSTLSVTDVAVLFGGSQFECYTVEADRELQDMIVDETHAFWQRVQRGEQPKARDMADARLLYPRGVARPVVASSEVRDEVMRLAQIGAEIARLKSEADVVQTRVCLAMGAHDGLLDAATGRTIATWKDAKGRSTIDAEALRAAHPDIAMQFTKTGEPSRRFAIKV